MAVPLRPFHPAHRGRIRGRLQGSPDHPAQVVGNHVVVAHPSPVDRSRGGSDRGARPIRRLPRSSRSLRGPRAPQPASRDSPSSSMPPGRDHFPFKGSWPRCTRSTRPWSDDDCAHAHDRRLGKLSLHGPVAIVSAFYHRPRSQHLRNHPKPFGSMLLRLCIDSTRVSSNQAGEASWRSSRCASMACTAAPAFAA